jgi:ATP-binding cassette, subfamily C, bacterial CydC
LTAAAGQADAVADAFHDTGAAPSAHSRPGAGRAPLARLLWLAGPLRVRLLVAVVTGALATGCGVALLAVSGFILARASQHPSIIAISVAVVAVRGLSIGRALLRYLERLASHDVAFRVLADVRVAIYRRLERLAPAGLHSFRSGDLLALLVSDVDSIQDLFVRGVAPQVTAALVGVGAAACCLLVLAPAGGVLAVGLLAAGVAVPWLAAATARRAGRRTARARGSLGAAVSELIAGAAELEAYGAQEAALRCCAEADAELTRLARRSALASGLGSGFGVAATGLTVWGVLVLGVAAVSGGTLTRVPLAVLTLTALAAFEAATPLPGAAMALGHSLTSARRITRVLDEPDPVREPAAPRTRPEALTSVALCGARVRYGASLRSALDGLDLDLRPGRRVALVGPSGAGKSTAASVLLRLCELSAGSALLNGHDLASYAADDVRAVVGGCAQDPHVFDASLRDNVRVGRPSATDAQLASAAQQAGLLTWIESLPGGWDTPAGARGGLLSGGQRQRLALARALLADPAVLVLDEPVAHLDRATRRELTGDLLAATRGRATLLITHDLEGLDQVDEIVVLDGGAVGQRGCHAQLLGESGWYAGAWRKQSAGWDQA